MDKYCDWLVATAVLNLGHLGSILDTLNPFYITHWSSVCVLTLFKLINNLDHQSFLFNLILWSRRQRTHTKPSTGL